MVKIGQKILCEHCFAETGREPCTVCGYSKAGYKCNSETLLPGNILKGRYAVGRVIGKGSYGITYLAYDMVLESRIAVKEYYLKGFSGHNLGSAVISVWEEELETFKRGTGRFYEQACLIAKLKGNPNIVSVYDVFYENHTAYFTMEYLVGMTLKTYLEKYGALSPAQAVYVAESVSNALIDMHSLNILHWCVSPNNIMVCMDGTVRLLDFGAARQEEPETTHSVLWDSKFEALDRNQGPWMDIYSLGMTLYYSLSLDIVKDACKRLFDNEEYLPDCHQIANELWQIIRKATALQIQNRYQNVFELKRDLNSLNIKPKMFAKASGSIV